MIRTVGSLCSGVAGLDLGLEYAGFETRWFCEIERSCWPVLERWNVPIYGDVKSLPLGEVEPVDVITAGYPCQPFSQAGRRLGESDPRHVWPDVARAVRVLRPRVVLLENVPNHLAIGFGRVLGDLAEAGYDAQWFCLRASAVGAPHRRERVFIVAAADADFGRRAEQPEPNGQQDHAAAAPSGDVAVGRDAAAGLSAGGGRGEERRGLRAPGPAGLGGRRPADTAPAADGFPWGIYGPAICRWSDLFRPVPRPLDDRGRLTPPFVEWMLGFPDGWTSGMDRIPAVTALGNAVQVQVAELVGQIIRDL